MKKITINQIVLMMSIVMTIMACKAQKLNNALPKVENHLKGALDYTQEALELVQKQIDGKEISLGKIDTDGTIHFKLPEFDIKALYDSINLQHPKLQQLFGISSDCKDRDVFAETPFDDVYSKKYDPIYIKKYGMNIATLYPVSDEIIVSRKNNQRAILPSEAKYFWFYIDRPILYKDKCVKVSSRSGAIYANISANIEFEKGWNFIEENLVDVQEVVQADSQTTTVRTTEFKSSSPASKKVKWVIKQFKDDEEIQVFKKLYNVKPITQEQFEKWAPNKVRDLSLKSKEYGIPPKGRKNKNNIHLMYSNESQKKEIDLYVVDYSRNPEAIEMIDFVYAMENEGKDKEDIKSYVAQYNERDKATKLLYKFGESMFVEAAGTNINAEELWEYIKKLNVQKLIKR